MILHLAAWCHLVVTVQTLTTHSCLLAAHKHKLYLSLWKCNATFHEEPCMVNDRESINHKFGPEIGNQVPVPQKVAVCGSGVKESRECQYVDNIYAAELVLSWTSWSGTDPNRIRHAVVNDENESMNCSYIRQREKPKDCTEVISERETTIYPYPGSSFTVLVYCDLSSPQEWKPKDCTEVGIDGTNTIYPYTDTSIAVSVYCNLSYSGGGWTVLQKRYDGSIYFYRNWAEYEAGFGDPAGEHWLGLAALHAMTNGIPTELYIGLTDHSDVYKYAKYGTFSVMNSANKYQLNVRSYSGTAGDTLGGHNGYKFSTHDQDNDDYPPSNCAVDRHGAWWYHYCTSSNLNGRYSSTVIYGVQYMYWWHFSDNAVCLKTSVMMFRPLSYTQP